MSASRAAPRAPPPSARRASSAAAVAASAGSSASGTRPPARSVESWASTFSMCWVIERRRADAAASPTAATDRADGAGPFVLGGLDVGVAELDPHRAVPPRLAQRAIDGAVDAGAGDGQRNPGLGPALDQVEGRPDDANQVAAVAAAEVRLDGAAVGLRIDHCHWTGPDVIAPPLAGVDQQRAGRIHAGGRALVLAGGVGPGHRASDQPRGPHPPAIDDPGEAPLQQVLIALGPGGQHLGGEPAGVGHVAQLALERRAAALAVGQVLHVAHVDADADHHELRRLSEAVALGQHAGQLVAVEQIVGPLERRLEPGRLADPLGHGHAGGQGEQPEDARLAVGHGLHRRPHHGREVQPGVRRRVPAPATAAAPGGLVPGDHHQAVRPAGIGQGRRPVHRRGHRGGVGHRRRRARRSAAAPPRAASAKAAGSGSVGSTAGVRPPAARPRS